MNSVNESFPTDSSQMDGLLMALQAEIDSFLLRMAAHFHSRKKQLVFLINNYDMMLGVAIVSSLLFVSIYSTRIYDTKKDSMSLLFLFAIIFSFRRKREKIQKTAKFSSSS
jgi:O-antigen/teichoic acid export membrane protein